MPGIALLYDDDAYVERTRPAAAPARGRPLGLMGRQVAGRAFLDAYFAHGSWSELVAIVRDRASARTLADFARSHPSSRSRARRLRFVAEAQLLDRFLPGPPATVLHLPSPPEARLAWARQHGGPHAFALVGVTHTLCSAPAITALGSLLTAPFEPYDALICTSRAVVAMVRAVTDAHAGWLRERHGGDPRLGVRLEHIPLGVDPERFRPATAAERAAARAELGIADDEVCVLFVGRLAHHAKAQPFPLYRAAAEAAAATGRRVHVVLAGWAANAAIREAFREGARRLADPARVSLVDGTAPGVRAAVWRAADVFCSPSDSIQETFGLAVVEALACGLPVIASDWDGYRDLIVDGETGLLVPTAMVEGALADVTARLVLGAVDYDRFLAACGQATVVDPSALAAALVRLIREPDLRRRLGAAARLAAVERFAWRHVIAAYEALWADQDAERLARRAHAITGGWPPGRGPACYPEPTFTFAGYPTRHIGAGDRLVAAGPGGDRLEALRTLPLTGHSAERRAADPAVLHALLDFAAAPRTIAELDARLAEAGVPGPAARATIAWLLKYGLLRIADGGVA